MKNQRIKNFWIDKINTALFTYSLDPSTLNEGAGWASKLNALSGWREIDGYGKAVFTDVFTKANQVAPSPLLDSSDNYGKILGDSYADLEDEFADLVSVFKTKIGVNPESVATISETLDDGSTVYTPKWKHDINQRITSNIKLTDIPDTLNLSNLLYKLFLYNEIVNELPDLISSNLTGADRTTAYGYHWKIKVNKAKLAEYKNLVDDLDIQKGFYDALIQVLNYNPTIDDLDATDPWKDLNNHLDGRSIIGLIQERDRLVAEIRHAINSTGVIPNNWHNISHDLFQYCFADLGINDINNLPNIPAGENLNTLLARVNHTCPATPCSLAHCPNTHSNYDAVKGESNEYQRIRTRLKSKISDSELDALLNPTCSHTDYDTIKQERDRLKTERASHECDSDGKVAAKETEIITKIITDLGLTTERERGNALEAVIAEIKTKISPPTDSSKEKELLEKQQTKIAGLEAKIANLQSSQSFQDSPISNQVKDEIAKISQALNLTNEHQVKLEKASSYQELSILQREAFQERLNGEISSKKNANYLNWALGSLALGSLLLLAYMLRKRNNSALPGKK